MTFIGAYLTKETVIIELNQLKQLVTIAEFNGNVSKAAEALYISQPTLSRSMQKLEHDFDVNLFDRRKNEIELNENGKLAVEHAKKLLDGFDRLVEDVRFFDRNSKTVNIGSCAPAPLWMLAPTISDKFPKKNISTELKTNDALIKGLQEGNYQVIITSQKTELPNCLCKEYCTERLHLCVPTNHPFAERKSVTYADFDGISMLLYYQIGVWDSVLQHLPKTRFIIQSDRTAFNDLVAESFLALFATNLSIKQYGAPVNRVAIPIAEDTAAETFYIATKKKNKQLIS